MGVLSILLVFLGGALGGSSGAIIFFIISLAINLFSYYNSDKIAIKMTGSQPISEEQAPELYAMIRRLVQRAGLPMPRLYLTPSQQPNAFATGRNPEHSAVAVTEGLLRLLNEDELEGVISHELAHVKNRDVLLGTIAASMAGAITMIGNSLQWAAMFGGFGNRDNDQGGIGGIGTLILAILAPIAATIIQLSISRSREFSADALGAKISGKPDGLANALLKLQSGAQQIPMQVNPVTSHMFIVNPLAGISGASLSKLFSTHPPIEERVSRLRQMR